MNVSWLFPSTKQLQVPETVEGTEIIYVCSPDYIPSLEVSLNSLLASGSEFDRISVYLTAAASPSFPKLDDRIVVNEVEPLGKGYFFANKLFVSDGTYRRAIILDVDTLILRPLQEIYDGRSADLLARPGSANALPDWNEHTWQSTFQRLGLQDAIPMLNGGLVVFQNGVHTRVRPHWAEYIGQYQHGELAYPCNDLRFFTQWSLSLVASKLGWDVMYLSSKEHAFGWRGDCADEAVVFHTGTQLFDRYTAPFKPFPKDEESKSRAVRMLVRCQLEDTQNRISALEKRLFMLQRQADDPVPAIPGAARVSRGLMRRMAAKSLLRRLAVRLLADRPKS